MIEPNRRGFLAGLVSACAAPAIITSAGFRPAILLPRCHERWLAVYNMYDDTYSVRADFAKHELVKPAGAQLVPPHLVAMIKAAMRKPVSECVERALRPGFQQHCFDWTMWAMRDGPMHESSIEKSLERALDVHSAAPGLGVVRGNPLLIPARSPLLQEAPSVGGGVGAAGAE